MDDLKSAADYKTANVGQSSRTGATDLPVWERPKIEDVSEQVMAQPYIRFT